jgi:hypothetical protein
MSEEQEVRLEVVKSCKGNNKLRLGGYLFQFSKDGVDKKIRRCDQWRNNKCPSRIHTSENLEHPELLNELGTHNHGADPVRCEVQNILTNLRHEARTTNIDPKELIASAINGIPEVCKTALPKIPSLKRDIRRARVNEISRHLILPRTRADINLPHVFKTTAEDAPFLLFDSRPTDDRIMIFTTDMPTTTCRLTPAN